MLPSSEAAFYGWTVQLLRRPSGRAQRPDMVAKAIKIPHDRAGSFDPALIAKYQRRFPGFDEKVISMYARGMSVREIARHVRELYGIEVSPDLISAYRKPMVSIIPSWTLSPTPPPRQGGELGCLRLGFHKCLILFGWPERPEIQ